MGKGIFSSSLGYLFKKNNQKVLLLKLDSCLNFNSKFIHPFENGEIFVTDDGNEVDSDIGHYERFLNEKQSFEQIITLGKILKEILKLENKNFFNWKKIEIFDDLFKMLEEKITFLINKTNSDITIIQVDSGDLIEDNFNIFKKFLKKIFLSKKYDLKTFFLIKIFKKFNIQKINKIINFLNINFIKIDYLILKSKLKISNEKKEDIKNKITLIKKTNIFNIEENNLFNFHTAYRLYSLKLFENLLKDFLFKEKKDFISENDYILKYSKIFNKSLNTINIGVLSNHKILNENLYNLYFSIFFSLKEAGFNLSKKINIINIFFESDSNNNDVSLLLNKIDGIVLPGGFGSSFIKEKIIILKYARENNFPILSICYGFQLSIIEYFRNVLNFKNAETKELSNNKSDLLIFNYINEEKKILLGRKKIKVKKNSLFEKCYKNKDLNNIFEKFRHFFVFQNRFKDYLKNDNNLIFSILKDDKNKNVSGFELRNHPFFMGVQFHPELSSCIENVHPIFDLFLEKINKIKKNKQN